MNDIHHLDIRTSNNLKHTIDKVIENYFYHYYSIDMEEDRIAPSVCIDENEYEFCVRILGSEKTSKNIDVSIDNKNLVIECHGRFGSQKHSSHQRRDNTFQRIIPIPDNALSDSAEAHFNNGEVCVKIPLQQHIGARSLEVH